MRRTLALLLAALPLMADLTPDQKEFDFRLMAAELAKRYAPYEWKRDVMKFDLYELGPWIDRVRGSKDDLAFYEIASEYLASLQDSHTVFQLPSNYQATVGFHVDVYDGKYVIDNIVRARLPESRYPFQNGDELVSIDGRPVPEWIGYLSRFLPSGNPRSRQRRAAQYLTGRFQAFIPRAHEIPDTSSFVVRRRNTGELETYDIQWQKLGAPVTSAGLVPSPRFSSATQSLAQDDETEAPAWTVPLRAYTKETAEFPENPEVLNVGSLFPVWQLPPGFQVRLGRGGDPFFSGTYVSQGQRIGYLRIPNFFPPSQAAALRTLETEMAYMQQNTDGLVIDVMRNPGGDGCYCEELQRRLMPATFRPVAREVRATATFRASTYQSLTIARNTGEPAYVVAQLEETFRQVDSAYRENRGRTGPVALCSPSIDRLPATVVYTKPILVLVDDFSSSAADSFAASMQDNKRAPLFGVRTNGAGGSTSTFQAGLYSEGLLNQTLTLMTRKYPVATPDFPTTYYVENVGVRPEIDYDLMTMENLLNQGRPFVQAFTNAIVEHIRRAGN